MERLFVLVRGGTRFRDLNRGRSGGEIKEEIRRLLTVYLILALRRIVGVKPRGSVVLDVHFLFFSGS